MPVNYKDLKLLRRPEPEDNKAQAFMLAEEATNRFTSVAASENTRFGSFCLVCRPIRENQYVLYGVEHLMLAADGCRYRSSSSQMSFLR